MRIKELRSLLSERLSSLENPALEARILLSFFLSMSHSELIINDTREIPEDRERAILDAAALRLEGVPMAYITGKKEFYGYTFSVNSDVLIPQPDTETLVETALDALKGNEKVLDICTGSGAIITSIKAQKPEIMAFFSDISEKALLVAKKNYESITGEKGCCRLGSLFEPWNGMRFNMITANPPYVTRAWYDGVSKEVKNEPELALIDEDDDGLGITRRIIEKAPSYLEKGGYLILEADYRQHEEIRNLLEKHGFIKIRTINDLSGLERVSLGSIC